MSMLKSDEFYDYESGKIFKYLSYHTYFPGIFTWLHLSIIELCFFQANYPVAKPLELKVTFKYEESKSRLVE